MSNKPASEPAPEPTRRQFFRRSAEGVGWLGLGSALGGWAGWAAAERTSAGTTGRRLGPEFSYDVTRFSKIDPSLIQYQESGSFQVGFKELRALTVGRDDQVCAAGDRQIRVFGRTGIRLSEFSVTELPRCLDVASDGSFYVGMKDHVEVYSSKGELKAKWESPGPKALLTSIAVGERDAFAADAGNRQVLRYDLSGKLRLRIGKKDSAKQVPGFIVPSPYFDLAIGPDGLLWVANPGRHRVEAYTFEGDFELAWGEPGNAIAGFCGCCNPAHFAFLPEGRLVTSEKGLPRLKVYSARGQFEGVVAGPEQFPKLIANPRGNSVGIDVAVDSQGRVLAADPATGAVRIFTRHKTV